MDVAIQVALYSSVAVYIFLRQKKAIAKAGKKARKHSRWQATWVRERDVYDNTFLFQCRLLKSDIATFRRILRMPPWCYEYILSKLENHIRRKDTNYRKSLTPAFRLSMTLRYLASGNLPLTTQIGYKVGYCTVNRVIIDTCQAIIDILGPIFLATPSTEAQWKKVAMGFEQRWQYPGCMGAIDGKHIRIIKPNKSGSLYYNYKGFFSIVLMAVSNSNKEFIYVDVGTEGRAADGGTWQQTDFKKALDMGTLTLPETYQLRGSQRSIPYHFISDDAFQLTTRNIKPFAINNISMKNAIFNYRLSRARMVIENTFGIVASKFQVLQTDIRMAPNNATTVVLAVCVLHNLLRKVIGVQYMPASLADREDSEHVVSNGSWRTNAANHMQSMNTTTSKNASKQAKAVREIVADYFSSEAGEVDWQQEKIAKEYPHFTENVVY